MKEQFSAPTHLSPLPPTQGHSTEHWRARVARDGRDLEARLALIAALMSRGVRVPGEVSVVGFDGIALGEISAPPLTTVSLQLADLSRDAFGLPPH